jgi:hypothetical protein
VTVRLLAVVLLALAATPGLNAVPGQTGALVLGTSGTSFTVDGASRFLVFVSYFDALDATALDTDFEYLAGRADGVRVFANWWDLAAPGPCRLRFSPGTVIGVGPDGSVAVRPDRLARLKIVLDRARAHGLLVDLTFAAEPVEGLSALEPDPEGRVCPSAGFTNTVRWRPYAEAVARVATALDGPEYRHVFFDLQNEAGHRLNGAGPADLALLADAVRRADPDRLLSVSMFDPDGVRQARLVARLKLACLNFHDWPRGPGWGVRTEGQVEKFRSALDRRGLRVPVYAGEPDADAYGAGTAEFRASLLGARSAGAAAWTFHTRAAHDLSRSSFVGALDADGRAFLDVLRPPGGPIVPGGSRVRPLGVN